jgi:hypothetical protein
MENVATILTQYKILQDSSCAAQIGGKQSVAKEF